MAWAIRQSMTFFLFFLLLSASWEHVGMSWGLMKMGMSICAYGGYTCAWAYGGMVAWVYGFVGLGLSKILIHTHKCNGPRRHMSKLITYGAQGLPHLPPMGHVSWCNYIINSIGFNALKPWCMSIQYNDVVIWLESGDRLPHDGRGCFVMDMHLHCSLSIPCTEDMIMFPIICTKLSATTNHILYT